MTLYTPAQCLACTRFQGRDAGTCTSFPDGIPVSILLWGKDHRRSWAGEPPFDFDPARSGEFWAWLTTFAPEEVSST